MLNKMELRKYSDMLKKRISTIDANFGASTPEALLALAQAVDVVIKLEKEIDKD